MYTINKLTGVITCPGGEEIRPPYDHPLYIDYAQWVGQGNNPNQVDSFVDATVSAYQAKAALAMMGFYDQVEQYINQDTTDTLIKLKWQYSNFRRSDPVVLQIADALGITNEQLDGLFALAATID